MPLIAFAAALPAAAQQRQQTADTLTVIVDGRLIDDTQKVPVAGATVQLLRRDSSVLVSVVSDTAGRFRLATMTAGPYRLRAERLGYETAVTAVLDWEPGTRLAVDFLLSVNAVVLDPIVVNSVSLAPAVHYRAVGMDDFYRRMVNWSRGNQGIFLTRDSLARYEAGHTITSVLGRFPGVNYAGPGRLMMRGGCTPRYFVNGAPFTPMPGSSIDEMFAPEALEAVEIYTGSAVPGDFFGRGCGVIAFWTRRS
jgi:hypothetical protein